MSTIGQLACYAGKVHLIGPYIINGKRVYRCDRCGATFTKDGDTP